MTVAGVDASAIGTSYKPTQVQVIPVLNSSTVVTWLNNDGQVAISGINGNQLTLISFTIVRVANAGELQFDEYSYALDCSLSGIDCSNIQVDTINKQAVFNNLELPLSTMPITENMATGPVTLVGTLTWD